jgi:paraquat-inducible protein B
MSSDGSGVNAAPPEPVLARQNRLHLSLVWIVPLVALVIGIVLVVRSVTQRGPEIVVEFRSAEGLEAGRTEVRYKEVVVGQVRRVRLSPDLAKVLVTIALDKSVARLAVQDTRFWVVRPRIGTGGVSGLATLLSGAYIGLDAGVSQESREEFTGLDQPPLVLRGEPGRSFVLRADDIGSLDVGSPVYHRRIRVGRVVGYTLQADGKSVQVQVFIEAPHERLVTTQSRFWNASGVDLSLSASGLTLNTQSIASVLAGGLAFATPEDAPADAAAAAVGHPFTLFANQRTALAPEDGEPLRVRMVFNQSLRGLEIGAPVELLGVPLGNVRSIEFQHDESAGRLPIEVTADIYPQRLAGLRDSISAKGDGGDRQFLKQLVARGLRAQARTGNLLTGQLYVALDFVPKAAAVNFDVKAAVPTLPTTPGALSDAQAQLTDILARVSKVRFDEIGSDLQETLKSVRQIGESLQTVLGSTDTAVKQLNPKVQQTLDDLQKTLTTAQQTLRSADSNLVDAQAPLQRSTAAAIAELQRAAQAMRVLADYLQKNPQTLLRGKPADPVLEPTR